MPSLVDMPAELRQQILSLTLPDTNRIGTPWPRSMMDLLHICHRLRQDMGPVLSTWSPIHYISFPHQIKHLAAHTVEIAGHARTPKLERICLDLFHESKEARMYRTCFCEGSSSYSHPELIAAWASIIPLLPRSLQEIYLDVTPAPAARRDAHRLVLNRVIDDRRLQTFLSCHIDDVDALVSGINDYYDGRLPICFTGSLSEKSKFYCERMRSHSEGKVEFVGTWVPAEKARFAKIAHGVHGIGSKQRGERHRFAKLYRTEWSQKTKWTYAKIAHEGNEQDALSDIRSIAEFDFDGTMEMLKMEPVGSVRRALQHRVVEDMGLSSTSEGDGDHRHVVVMRLRETGVA